MKRYLFLIWLLSVPIIAQANFGESFLNDSTWITFQPDQNATACTLWADNADTLGGWTKSAVGMNGSGTTWQYKTTFTTAGSWLVKIRYWVGGVANYSTGTWRVIADSTKVNGLRAGVITNTSIADNALTAAKIGTGALLASKIEVQYVD